MFNGGFLLEFFFTMFNFLNFDFKLANSSLHKWKHFNKNNQFNLVFQSFS